MEGMYNMLVETKWYRNWNKIVAKLKSTAMAAETKWWGKQNGGRKKNGKRWLYETKWQKNQKGCD